MDRQHGQSMLSPAPDGIVVVEDNGASFSIQLYLSVLSPGECFLIARDRAWNAVQSKNASIERVTEILKSFETGRFQEHSYGELVTSLKHYGPIKSNPSASWSLRVAQGSAESPQRLVKSSASSESSCPSLENHCSTDGGEPSRSSAASGGASTKIAAGRLSICPLRSAQQPVRQRDSPKALAAATPSRATTAPKSHSESEPLIFASIRRILSADPSYAEEVISAVKQLPDDKRDLLFFRARTEPADDHIAAGATQLSSCNRASEPGSDLSANIKVWEAHRTTTAASKYFDPIRDRQDDLECSHAAEDGLGSPPQASSGQPSTSNGVRNKTAGPNELPKSSAGESKKRPKAPDDDDGNGDEGDRARGGGGGGGSTRPDKKQKKSDKRWACPYCLAYAHILDITRFRSCRPPGFLKKRSDWRDHLKKYHSPEARLTDPLEANALFYMDDQQWRRVQDKIDAADQSRPRPYEDWFEVQKTCFLAVWRIIFPKSRFPSLQEPVSPFHPDGHEIANLRLQGQVLLEAIFDVRARRAVGAGSIASIRDFRPAREEYLEMMSETFEIVTSSSPGAAQWVANASSQALQAAVADHGGQIGDQPDQHAWDEDHAPATTPEPMPEPRTPEPAPRGQTTPETLHMRSIPFPLFLSGTQIYMEVAPSFPFQPDQQQLACLQVYTPVPFNVPLINLAPMATSTMVSAVGPPPMEQVAPPQLIEEKELGGIEFDVFSAFTVDE